MSLGGGITGSKRGGGVILHSSGLTLHLLLLLLAVLGMLLPLDMCLHLCDGRELLCAVCVLLAGLALVLDLFELDDGGGLIVFPSVGVAEHVLVVDTRRSVREHHVALAADVAHVEHGGADGGGGGQVAAVLGVAGDEAAGRRKLLLDAADSGRRDLQQRQRRPEQCGVVHHEVPAQPAATHTCTKHNAHVSRATSRTSGISYRDGGLKV